MKQKEKNRKKASAIIFFKSVLFAVIFLVMFASATKTFTSPGNYQCYQWVQGFYSEKKNSLDAVYIGSSATYAFWQAALGWKSHGITVWPYATSSQPQQASRYIIEDARKTQPDALYIIDVSSGELDATTASAIHWLIDYMPWSVTKLKLIHSLCEMEDYALGDRLGFYLPLYQYHSRWDELVQQDFDYKLDGTKGGSQHSNFLKTSTDVSGSYREMDLAGELTAKAEAYYEDLFDYIDRENIKVLFISNTGLTTSEIALAGINRVMEMAEARGYSTLNLKDQVETLGLNTATDYYNALHTNIHGSIKYTEYLANYLVEHYGFQDKRGQEGYESWDLAVEKYQAVIAPYVVEEELDASTYDSSLQIPELTALKVNGTNLTLQWKSVKGAVAYHIYRRQNTSQPWELLAEVTANTLSYEDTGLDVRQSYIYTVVPQGANNGRYYHGDYSFSGISATTVPNAPKLLELEGDSQSQTLSWKKVPGADGYYVLRKIHGKSWISVADVGTDTEYTDTNLFGGEVPFQYTVRAYILDQEGIQRLGSYDSNGLLWLPQIQDIGLTVSTESGAISLSWEGVIGADRYYIYRRTKAGEWTQIAEPLSGTAATFEDMTAESGVPYQYRVAAALTYSGNEYQYAFQETAVWYQAVQDSVVTDSPKIVFAGWVGQGVDLVWEPASSASAYRIYRKTETSDWKVVKASVTGSTYSDLSIAKDEESAAYVIQALYEKDGAVFCGEFSEDMAVTVRSEQEE